MGPMDQNSGACRARSLKDAACLWAIRATHKTTVALRTLLDSERHC